MSGITINVRLEDKEVRAMLARLQARMSNLRPVMAEIGQIVRSSVVENFRQGGRPRWTPTKMRSRLIGYAKGSHKMAGDEGRRGITYRKGKKVWVRGGKTSVGFQRYASGKKTLIDTARLMNSINSRAYADRVEVGTNVVYAAIHHFGGPAGRGKKVKIPARPYLMVQNEDWREIRAALADYLMKGAR